MKIYLLTNDADNRRKALSEHLDAMSVQVHCCTHVLHATLDALLHLRSILDPLHIVWRFPAKSASTLDQV